MEQLEVALAAREADGEEKEKQQGEAETVDQAASQRVDAFLSSAASRLEAVESNRRRSVEETPADEVPTRKQQEALLGPLGTGASRCKTLTSSEGVLQNPLGRHEGKRVWGGGMVTLRKREWIPWAIDQLVKEEQADHPEFQQTGADYAPFAHRVTELAKGEGLSSISSVTWGASVGNVHTAAVPPWMVQTEEEYKQCNRREQEAPSPALLTLKNDKVEVKRKKGETSSRNYKRNPSVVQTGCRILAASGRKDLAPRPSKRSGKRQMQQKNHIRKYIIPRRVCHHLRLCHRNLLHPRPPPHLQNHTTRLQT